MFTIPGVYQVTLTVTDALGLADPTPAVRVITVTAADTTPPVRSSGSPTGTLPAGTTSTVMSLATDEAATCKYATTAGTAYSAMTSQFTTTGGTAHLTTVSGLTNGQTYTYYVRCQDAAGNANTNDYAISFQVLGGSSSLIPRTGWSLKYVDSQESKCENGAAVNAFDGNTNTIWHTQYCPTTAKLPHEIQIDMGQTHTLNGFRYLPRQDDSINGTIKNYEFYVSTDGVTWGTPVATGSFSADVTEKEVSFLPKTGRYFRLKALTEVNGGPWTSMAEINVLGSME